MIWGRYVINGDHAAGKCSLPLQLSYFGEGIAGGRNDVGKAPCLTTCQSSARLHTETKAKKDFKGNWNPMITLPIRGRRGGRCVMTRVGLKEIVLRTTS